MAADSEISLLARSSTPLKATQKTWSSEEEVDQPGVKLTALESGVPSVEPKSLDTTSASSHKASAQSRPSEGASAKLVLSFNASQSSVQSTDTTLEYFDAPLSKDQDGEEPPLHTDDDVVTVNIQPPAEQEQADGSPVPLQSTEDAVGAEEEDKEKQVVEEPVEEGAEIEELVQSEEVEEQDAAAPEQADLFSYSRGRSSP